MRTPATSDVLIVAGIALLIGGIGMMHIPGAVITLGLIVIAIGYLHTTKR